MKTSVLFSQEVVVVVVRILTFLVSASDDIRSSGSATKFHGDVIPYDDVKNDVKTHPISSHHVQRRDVRSKWLYLLNISNYDDKSENDVSKNMIQSNTENTCTNSNGWNLKGSEWGCCGNYDGCCTYASIVCYIHDAMCRCCDVSVNFCGPKCKPEMDCFVLKDINTMLSDSAAAYSHENNAHDGSASHDLRNKVMATSSLDTGSEELEGSGETIYKPEVPD
ncbi:hypothetical protein ACF0H5_022400 [Mactra antiquata]